MSDLENSWRLTAIPAKFIFVDSRVAILIPPVMLHIRLWTLGVFVVAVFVFAQLERRGYTIPVALRMMKIILARAGRKSLRITPFPLLWRWNDRPAFRKSQ